MKTLSAVDWQSFTLRKDVEKIARHMSAIKVSALSLAVEMLLVVCGAVYECFKMLPFLLLSVIVAIVPFIWTLIQHLYRKSSKEKLRNSVKSFISAFDNEICYYVMMSDSFYNMITDEKEIAAKDSLQFYYIESCYYLSKAVDGMAPLYYLKSRVLCDNATITREKGLIAMARMQNVINMIDRIFVGLKSNEAILDGLSHKGMIIEMNQSIADGLDSAKQITRATKTVNNPEQSGEIAK